MNTGFFTFGVTLYQIRRLASVVLRGRLLRFNRRLRASVRGLPFKCKATKVAMAGDLLLPGEISQCTQDCRSPNFVQRDNRNGWLSASPLPQDGRSTG